MERWDSTAQQSLGAQSCFCCGAVGVPSQKKGPAHLQSPMNQSQTKEETWPVPKPLCFTSEECLE